MKCECCGAEITDEYIVTNDDAYFCSCDCAHDDGYECCDYCGNWTNDGDFFTNDDEFYCCESCLENAGYFYLY